MNQKEKAPRVELMLDTHAVIGESPTWNATEGTLYWIDVKEPALHRFNPTDGSDRNWTLTSDVGAFALTADGGAIVALRGGIHHLDLANGALECLAPPPFDPALFRFNEGACDSAGRFWVGVMFDPLHGSPDPRPGSLFSFTLKDGLRAEPDAAELHNGMAWSADGRRFFVSHSREGEIYAFDFDVERGRLGGRRPFARIAKELGIPDGAAIDEEGGYWCALHRGSRLRRFHPDGRFDRDIALPVSKPTMCAFAGAALDQLYVTSASEKLSAAERKAERHAGGLFRLEPGATGIRRNAHCAVAAPASIP